MSKLEFSPNSLSDLVANMSFIEKALNSGDEVLISSKNWNNKAEETAETEVEALSFEGIARHFKDEYTESELEKILQMRSYEMPVDIRWYLQSELLKDKDNHHEHIITHGLLQEMISNDKDLVHSYEEAKLSKLSVPRYDTKGYTIDIALDDKMGKEQFIVMQCPKLLKAMDPDTPDFIIVGNFSKSQFELLAKLSSSYNWNTALVSKYKFIRSMII